MYVFRKSYVSGGRRTDGLKAADIVPILRERVAYLSGEATFGLVMIERTWLFGNFKYYVHGKTFVQSPFIWNFSGLLHAHLKIEKNSWLHFR